MEVDVQYIAKTNVQEFLDEVIRLTLDGYVRDSNFGSGGVMQPLTCIMRRDAESVEKFRNRAKTTGDVPKMTQAEALAKARAAKGGGNA